MYLINYKYAYTCIPIRMFFNIKRYQSFVLHTLHELYFIYLFTSIKITFYTKSNVKLR